MSQEKNQCVVCQQTLPEDRYYANLKHKNIWVSLCCPVCFDKFKENPDGWIARIEAFKAMDQIRHARKSSPE